MPVMAVPRSTQQVIHLHREAPVKPAWGQACNGCGVCCLAEPCPLGQLISAKRHGACDALRWDEDQARYRCGVVADPRDVLPWLPAFAAPWLRRTALRWISAARGCDSDAELMG